MKTLLEAIALVVLVIFVFLQTWRSTIIPAITIPVSLVGAFAFIKVMDFSINTLTLFAIILATGIVDDAIVVIENIERHIQEYRRRQAGGVGCDARGLRRGHRDRPRAGGGVRAGRVLPGMTGRLYAQFSITIAFAVALSVFNAVTLTPALSALLLDRRAITRDGSSRGSSGSSPRARTDTSGGCDWGCGCAGRLSRCSC